MSIQLGKLTTAAETATSIPPSPSPSSSVQSARAISLPDKLRRKATAAATRHYPPGAQKSRARRESPVVRSSGSAPLLFCQQMPAQAAPQAQWRSTRGGYRCGYLPAPRDLRRFLLCATTTNAPLSTEERRNAHIRRERSPVCIPIDSVVTDFATTARRIRSITWPEE